MPTQSPSHDFLFARLFAHMAWANQEFFKILTGLPDTALTLDAWNPEWSVGVIANHIVIAQGRFIARLEKGPMPVEMAQPLTGAGMAELGRRSAENDAKLATFLGDADELLTFVRMGQEVSFMKSTLLTQIIHHATDHRAQVSSILAARGMDVINLDALDLWSFERAMRA
jgi:uncharacterized damage-inducible protein DinB